jgi:Flp pilus assembly protein TadB
MATEWNIRVSDTEREAVAGQLREHYAQGRLTTDELNERLDRVFAAKTRSELAAVTSDLPYAPPPGSLPSDSMHGGYQQAGWTGQGWTGSNWTGPGRGGYGPRSCRGSALSFIPVLLAVFCCIAVLSALGFGVGSGPSLVVIVLGALAVIRWIFGRGRRGAVRRRGPVRRRRW